MNRRDFFVASAAVPLTSAMLPLLSAETLAAGCKNKDYSMNEYNLLLQNIRPIARGNRVTTEMIDSAITTLSQTDSRQATTGAVLKLVDIALKDEGLLAEIDMFINDYNGPEVALGVLLANPEVFLNRPAAIDLSDRLGRILKRDATLFLLAANNLGTDGYSKYLPPNLPVTRDPAQMAKEANDRRCPALTVVIGLVVFVISVIFAIVLAAIIYGADGSILSAVIIATAVLFAPSTAARGGILSDKLTEIIDEFKVRVDEGVPERAHLYSRKAIEVATNCGLLQNSEERAACLEASLLLCANAY